MDSPTTQLISSLEQYKIQSLPSGAYYIADFITSEEEQTLLNKIATAPKPRWKQLAHRRLQTWPSDLTNNTLLESPLPLWLSDPIISRILTYSVSSTDSQRHIFTDSPHGKPNHVLVNEYLPGQGIMPHKDGSAYHPVVATVSLGASLCLEIYDTDKDGKPEGPRSRILQQPRSLLITTDELYTKYFHGISDSTEEINLSEDSVTNWKLLGAPDEIIDGRIERRTRLSLTYRDVKKSSRLGGKLLFGRR